MTAPAQAYCPYTMPPIVCLQQKSNSDHMRPTCTLLHHVIFWSPHAPRTAASCGPTGHNAAPHHVPHMHLVSHSCLPCCLLVSHPLHPLAATWGSCRLASVTWLSRAQGRPPHDQGCGSPGNYMPPPIILETHVGSRLLHVAPHHMTLLGPHGGSHMHQVGTHLVTLLGTYGGPTCTRTCPPGPPRLPPVRGPAQLPP